jgi:hypothetical protein
LLSFGPRNPEGEVPLGCPATLLTSNPATAGRIYSWLAPSTHRKPLLRGAAGHFNRLLDPGAWGVASPLRLHVDFVVNTAFVVKTLQVRQQGRLRELHRLWCWPPAFLPWPRSTWISVMHSHARTSAKIDATLFYVAAFFLLFLSPEIARRSSQKNK